VEEATSLFVAMLRCANIVPTVATHAALMRAALQRGMPEVALQVWEGLKSTGLRPDSACLNMCLDALLRLVRSAAL
jgi:pentatricopeptide repeat protein